MHFAHTKGVVHRDLNPANIMFGDFGEVYVLDSGVAKVLSKDAAPLSQGPNLEISHLDFTVVAAAKTASGAIIGTPGYMAPEQILGQSGGFVADVCVHGADAVQQAAAVAYDVILLDWMLPDLDGLAVCRALRRGGAPSRWVIVCRMAASTETS